MLLHDRLLVGILQQEEAAQEADRGHRLALGSPGELQVITDWWADCEQGTRPFLWIENPATQPTAYLMQSEEPDSELTIRRLSRTRYEVAQRFVELPWEKA